MSPGHKRQIVGMRTSRLPGRPCSRSVLKGRVSPRGCTPAPHPSCEPLWAQRKPAPSGLCGTEFPVGLQSWWSFWRGFRSRSCEIPDPESIPAIFQIERGQQLMRLLPNDKNRFKPGSCWRSANPWATVILPCWPPLTQAPTALCRDGGALVSWLASPGPSLKAPTQCWAAGTLAPKQNPLHMSSC